MARFLTVTTLISSGAIAAFAAAPGTAALAAATCAPANGFAAQTLTPPTAFANGSFGFPAVTGDFNADGYSDAAIGHLGDKSVGSVSVYLGSAQGLVFQNALSPIAVPSGSSGWHFGSALATGDFNGDGFDELAVGAPGTSSNAGSVYSYKGSGNGLQNAQYSIITQEFAGETTEAGDRFGSALAAGDFNGDGKDDLAMGADEEGPAGSTVRSGEVIVVQGSANGLSRGWIIRQAALGQTAKAGDEFGVSLTAGQIVGNSRDDLIVGSRRKDVGTIVDTGAVFILDGAGNKLSSNPIFKTQGTVPQGTPALDEASDQFGSASAIGDFNKDGTPDLAVGVPYESYTSTTRRGSVQVFPGPVTKDSAGYYVTPGALNDSTGNNDYFGGTLRAGDVDGDSVTDLLVGASGTPRAGLAKAGAVGLFSGTDGGVLRAERFIVQGDVGGTDAASDAFGVSIALGDFDKDSRTDGIISAFGESRNGIAGAGAAYLLDDLNPITNHPFVQNAPMEGVQSPPVGTGQAPIRYAYVDNAGGPRILTQTDPTSTSSVVRAADTLIDGYPTGRAAIGQTAAGLGVVAVRSVTGDVWLRTQTDANTTAWGPWINYGGPDLGGIGMATLANGRLGVFGIGTRGELSIMQQMESGKFGAWQSTGIGNLTGDPVAVAVSGGTRIFATDTDGNLQSAIWNGSAMTGCATVGDRTITGRPAVISYPSGNRLRLFATTPDRHLITIGQDPSGAFEQNWAAIEGEDIDGSPAAVFDRDSARITVMAPRSDRLIWGATETAQGTSQFGEWTQMSNTPANTEVTAVPYAADGRNGYYFVFRDVNNRELYLVGQNTALAAARRQPPTFVEKALPKP